MHKAEGHANQMMANPSKAMLDTLVDKKNGHKWFEMYGGNNLMYAKPVVPRNGQPVVEIHSADGALVFEVDTIEVADVVIRQNDMEMVRVH